MLSTDTPLHPDNLKPIDLVPSRYAVQVGEIDALVVSDGVLPLPTSTMATNADP
ncbi:MAG: MBL fold metallo-hydrolase, partial [Achromobacter sp.]